MLDNDPLEPCEDGFEPPKNSVLVSCLHCGEVYESYRIEWRVQTGGDGRPHGFWCCPINNCDGVGFGFDIFPVDPDYIHEQSGEKMWVEDDVSDEDDMDDMDEFDDSHDGHRRDEFGRDDELDGWDRTEENDGRAKP